MRNTSARESCAGRVEVKRDEMIIDLSDVSKQVRGFYNSGITTGHACAEFWREALGTAQ